ncbi:hypothetical protein ACFWXH_07430 [Mesorhizobium sp. NPDC059054]|uniref:hypothetical protein n=1 Tax=Mesorhizobium sp. NPDC059054 TaxID=3346711 RepID=UPI00369CF843
MKHQRQRLFGAHSLGAVTLIGIVLSGCVSATGTSVPQSEDWKSVSQTIAYGKQMDKAGMRPLTMDCKFSSPKGGGESLVVKIRYVKSKLPKPFFQFWFGPADEIAKAEKFARFVDMPRTIFKTLRDPKSGHAIYCGVWSRER